MINAKNTEQVFKDSAEFMRKTTEMFSDGVSRQMTGKTPDEFYTWWSKTFQESFPAVAKTVAPEVLTPIIHRSLQNGVLYLNMMNAFLFSAMAIDGKSGMAQQSKEFVDKFSQQNLEWYQENLGKYLNVPQSGMYRDAFLKITATIDAYNKFLAEVGNFSETFNVPFAHSLEIFQGTLQNYQEDGAVKVRKKMSTLFMNVLGQEYDTFLKSPECATGIADVIHKYAEFQEQLNSVVEIWGKWLAIPSKKDFEEVCKEVYQLRKQVREQEARMQEQDKLIADLSQTVGELKAMPESAAQFREQGQIIEEMRQQLQKLEAAAKTAAPKKKPSTRNTTRKSSRAKTSSSKTASTTAADDAK